MVSHENIGGCMFTMQKGGTSRTITKAGSRQSIEGMVTLTEVGNWIVQVMGNPKPNMSDLNSASPCK